MDFAELNRQADRLLADYQHAKRSVTDEKDRLSQAKQRQEDALTAQQLLQGVAQAIQQQAHQRIAAVVTKCLRTVFGEKAYDFRIEFERKRGKTEAKLLFHRNGQSIHPTRASGGGVVDVAAFSLRLSAVILSHSLLQRLLILDEPFRFVSASYRSQLRGLLAELSEALGVQILMVTHSKQLMSGRVLRLTDEGVEVVEERGTENG